MINNIILKNKVKILSLCLGLLILGSCDINMMEKNNINSVKNQESLELASNSCSLESCYIYHDDFSIKRIYGLAESQIEKFDNIKKYYFNEDDLQNIIEREVNSNIDLCDEYNYCKIDIKAKIILNNEVYFIDSNGYMRTGDRYYKINIEKLIDIIKNKENIKT